MPILTAHGTTATVASSTWTGAANATGPQDTLFATWSLTTAGASGSLDIGGFNVSAIPAGSQINQVTYTLGAYVNNTARMLAPQSQAMVGTTTVGALNTSTLTTTTTNTDTFTVPATLTDLQASTFKVRAVARRSTNTQAATTGIGHVTLTVDYTVPGPAAELAFASWDSAPGLGFGPFDAVRRIAGDLLEIEAGSSNVVTGPTVNLTGSHFGAAFANAPVNTTSGATGRFELVLNTDNTVGISLNIDFLYFRWVVAGVTEQVALRYDPIAHRFLRVRDTGGQIVWESSPTGQVWTVRRGPVAAPFALTGLQTQFRALGAGTATTPARFGPVNTYPAPPNPDPPSGEVTVAPWSTVTLPAGPWAQTGGPAVTVTAGAFTAPPTMAGSTVVFTAGSATYTVTVTRSPHGLATTGAPTPVRLTPHRP